MIHSVNKKDGLKWTPRHGTLRSMHEPQPSAAPIQDGKLSAALQPEEQARGRRLALLSHPFAMTYRRLVTEDLPTLALVSLGAGDAVVGLQRAFEPLSALLQLPSLRALAHMSKRSLLIAGQCVAVAGGLPLLFFASLAALGHDTAVLVAVASFAIAATGLGIAETPWFPMLYSYVRPDRIGRFFGTLRSSWHVALIVSFIGAQRWLSAHPGDFAPVFAAALTCGVLRIAIVWRLPERTDAPRVRIRARSALAEFVRRPELRRYFLGVALAGGARRAIMPFAIVVMRRVVGMTEAQVLLATLASFVGGLGSLYVAGRAADRFGSAPVFRASGIGLAVLALGFCALREPGYGAVLLSAALFCGIAALAAAFGVADTNVLFSLASPEDPTPILTAATAATSSAFAVAPVLAGLALQLAIGLGVEELVAYRALFVIAAIAFAASWIPLQRFGLAQVQAGR
jgi:predicted MFS family arabinose efflux permease